MKFCFHIFSLLLLLAAASACGAVRPVIQPTDSTRVEVRVEREFVHDTAYVELPVIVEKIQTLDTTSTLENDYARSEASVTDGILKPAQLPVPVEKEIVYRDSIVFRDRVVTEVKEVERQLTFWQQFKMKAGVAAMILTVLYGLYLLARLYLKKK